VFKEKHPKQIKSIFSIFISCKNNEKRETYSVSCDLSAISAPIGTDQHRSAPLPTPGAGTSTGTVTSNMIPSDTI
jgi:hypothetical protein